jgi:hypothetical protein
MAHDLKSFWTADGYQLQHWGMDGQLLHDYAVYDVPWVVPARASVGDAGRTPATIVPPETIIHHAGVDSAGLLWMGGYTPTQGTRGRSAEFTSRLEVFDPIGGRLLVSEDGGRLGPRFVARSNLAYNTTVTEVGINVLNVYRLAIVRP